MQQRMRFRIPTAFVLVAAFLGSGTALATASGPSISEFETGLTPGVQLWGITSGPDGNTWFTEENNNAVGRVTPGAVITEFTRGLPHRQPEGHRHAARTATSGSPRPAATARSRA